MCKRVRDRDMRSGERESRRMRGGGGGREEKRSLHILKRNLHVPGFLIFCVFLFGFHTSMIWV